MYKQFNKEPSILWISCTKLLLGAFTWMDSFKNTKYFYNTHGERGEDLKETNKWCIFKMA